MFLQRPSVWLYGVIHKHSLEVTVYIFERISVLVFDHQMCFRVKGLNCFAEISSIDAILWCCERCQEKTERVRGVTRFVFMAQLVFCWSSLLAPGRGLFILLIYIKCSPTKRKKNQMDFFLFKS